jgi:hypothetical protein
MSYNTTKVYERLIDGGKQSQITLTKKKGEFSPQDVNDLIVKLHNDASKKQEKIKLMVRGLAVDKWATLKGFGDENFDVADYQEYFHNRVKNDAKFNKFSNLQLTMVKLNKK